MDDTNQLAEKARKVAAAGDQAIAWIKDQENSASVGDLVSQIERDLRRQKLQATRLIRAAQRPMAVAVFGPSQVGKSHLVSVLARKGEEFFVSFEGMPPVSYIQKINPYGGKESTGLVTRFTIKKRPGARADLPVQLDLLAHADVIKIIANAYFFEGKPSRYETLPEADEILAHAAKYEELARLPDGTSGLQIDDVWDIADYFQQHLKEFDLTKRLGGFWEIASRIAPKLAVNDLGGFFSILWGRHDRLTDLYRQLVGALQQLGFETEVLAPFIAIDSTLPDTRSILDVEALVDLGKQDAPALKIATKDGRSAVLPRAIIAALTAELQILLPEKPWDFFDHTDILDFPGYRTRGLPESGDEDGPQGLTYHLSNDPVTTIKEMVLRGKVEYLFQRYSAEQELTALLLCMKEEQSDVKTLPDVVSGWIASTYGPRVSDRVGKDVLLFLVLTRFDKHFEKKDSDVAGLDKKFRARMHVSLFEPFGSMQGSWPLQWTPNEPFTNTFLMRNPNVKNEAIFSFDGKREAGVRPEQKDYIEQLRAAFISLTSVQTHFVDPSRAFDEMMKFNDGGASFIAEKLALVCKPSIKPEQVRQRLGYISGRIVNAIQRFYISTNVDERLAERTAIAKVAMDELYSEHCEKRFGSLLRALMIDVGTVSDRFRYALTHRERAAVKPAAAAAPVDRPRPGQAAARSSPAPVSERRAPPASSREATVTETALRVWVETMYGQADNARFCTEVGISGGTLREMIGEIAGAANRLKLNDQMVGAIQRFAHEERRDDFIAKASIVCEQKLNQFVSDLGWPAQAPSVRPVVPEGEGERPVFTEKRPTYIAAGFPSEQPAYRRDYFEDWTFGYYRLVEDNARSSDGNTINVQQNNRLGAILDTLKPIQAAGAP